MGWHSYGLDQQAQHLVLNAMQRDRDSLNQSYKMRMSVAYGLERFWGEHLRLKGKEQPKSDYWKETWDTLVKIMGWGGIAIPNDNIDPNDPQSIRSMSEKLWQLDLEAQRISLAVLTQLCDCLIWWTQRYK